MREAISRLKSGNRATSSVWPEPPPDLVPLTLDPLTKTQYAAEISDRLVGIDKALASAGNPVEAAAVAYRHVHTMKGAASAVGDEPMSWFCHGLEDRLKDAQTGDAATTALKGLARWRAVLGALLEDPQNALRMLRGISPRSRSLPAPQATSPRSGDDDPRAGGEDATIRVEAASIDRLIDRFVAIGLVRERIAARAERTRDHARKMRQVRAELTEALRLIGPPRPWGAPAAALTQIEHSASIVAALGDELEQTLGATRGCDVTLKDSITDGKRVLSRMRQTPLKEMFGRLAAAVEAEARRTDREVNVRMVGSEETIDRRLAELLVEPCLQIARNSVAHGIEPVAARLALGKPAAGTLTLWARKSGNRLRVTIEDDGAGVDVAAVRKRAVEAGAVAHALADAADDNTLLALLFLPGFSTRETSDLLAGRGIGLDIALSAIQRLGGVLRLSSRYRQGFSARVEVPVESGLGSVLWVRAGNVEYALPTAHTIVVRKNEGDRTPHLAACLEALPNRSAAFAIELDVDPDEHGATILVGVDGVGRTEEVLIRPLTPLLASMGPYSGAVIREDGSLHLALDVFALAPRARALGRVPERTSAFPSERSRYPPSRPSGILDLE